VLMRTPSHATKAHAAKLAQLPPVTMSPDESRGLRDTWDYKYMAVYSHRH